MKRPTLFALIAGYAFFAPSSGNGAFVVSGAIPATATMHPYESEESDTLPELSVVSHRADKTLSSAIPFHTLDKESMLHTGVTDISDALRRLPGVNLRDYGGAGGLKTVSVRGLGAQHTGVAYDGVPLSDARSGEIDLSRYSLDNVSSLSLTAGDAEEIFITARAAASAANLSLSTFRPDVLREKGPFLTAQLRAGGFGLWAPYANAGWSNGENLAAGATFDFIHARNDYPFTLRNGNYTTRERRSNSMMNSFHGEINAEWRPEATTSVTGKLYYYDNARRLPGPVIYYLQETNERLHERNFFGQARWRRKMSSKLSLQGVGKFNWSSSRYTDRGGQYPGGLLDQYYLQRETYIAAALLWLPMDGLAVDYSADWVYQNLGSNLPTDTRPFRNTVMQSLTARYTFKRLTATARLLHTLYLDRSSDDSSFKADAQRFSPSLSISVRPMEERDLYFRTSYRNIFRSPTFNELYFDHYGTINLKPESADQWNIGATWRTSGGTVLKHLEITTDGYINLVSNKIVAVPFSLFKWTMTNLGKVRIFGLDATLNTEFAISSRHSILLVANYSYQRVQPRTDPVMLDWMKQVAYTPLNSGSGSVSWLNPWVSVVIHGNATSARYTTSSNLPDTRIAGYADIGLTLFHTFTIRGHSLELRADITNLTDKQYQIVSRYPMPGRNWGFSVKFEL